jgi:hypothetical protein
MEFETRWHLKWFDGVQNSLGGMSVTLLVRNPKNNRIYVNLDP